MPNALPLVNRLENTPATRDEGVRSAMATAPVAAGAAGAGSASSARRLARGAAHDSITMEGVSKLYRLGAKVDASATLISAVGGWVRAPLRNYRKLKSLSQSNLTEESPELLWALRDVSMQIRHGDVVGIIGSNGAGKSTILKLLARITQPTRGRLTLRGRVGSLLEVGTGFHLELTGRENVYLIGAILGMNRHEIDAAFSEIVEFSGISRFIDTPAKRYSSGMRVRLAFSVVAHLQPEILLVDEILAVGDLDFQQQSVRKMKQIASEGRTVIMVSHDIAIIRELCNRGILMKAGQVLYDGSVEEAARGYMRALSPSGAALWEAERTADGEAKPMYREEISHPLRISRVAVVNGQGAIIKEHPYNEPFYIQITTEAKTLIGRSFFTVSLQNENLETIIQLHDISEDEDTPDRPQGAAVWQVAVPAPMLAPGDYRVTLRLNSMLGRIRIAALSAICPFRLVDSPQDPALSATCLPMPASNLVPPLHWTVEKV